MPERRNFLLGIGIGGAFIYSLFRWYRSGRFWFNYDRHAHIKDKTPVASPSSGDKTPKRERRVHFTAAAPVEIHIVEYNEEETHCVMEEVTSDVEDKDLQCDQQRVERSKNSKSCQNYMLNLSRNRSFSM